MMRNSALSYIRYRRANTNAGINYKFWQCRTYAKDGKVCVDCCKEVSQTIGKQEENVGVETTCSGSSDRAARPMNYDPYRIKVPEIAVPPLPASSAKDRDNEDTWELFRSPGISSKVKDVFSHSALTNLDYWNKDKNASESDVQGSSMEAEARLSYHGRSKYKFAFHEPWRPLDRLSLMAEAERLEKEREEQERRCAGSDFVKALKAPQTETS